MLGSKARDDDGRLGLSLYVVTVLVDLVTAGAARFVLVYALLGGMSFFVGLPTDVAFLSLVFSLLPTGYSIVGAVLPQSGRLWRVWLGAREPTGEECERLDDAISMLASYSSVDLPPLECYVIDVLFPVAITRGKATILSRALIYEDGLAAKLAHEYGHVISWDGRLTEALHRLELWSDPLYGGTDAGAEARGGSGAGREGGAWVFGLIRLLVWVAGGVVGRFLLRRPWSWYWRQREFSADAMAAVLGQREDLRRHLEERELLLDGPQAWLERSRYDHPYVAERIDHLRLLTDGGEEGE